jgi:hypothetical protein
MSSRRSHPRRLFATGVLAFAAILGLGIFLSHQAPAGTNTPFAPNGSDQTAPAYGY